MKTVRRGLWQLRGRFFGGDLILGYHRVAKQASDPWNLCIPPTDFLEQMRVLRRDFLPVPLAVLTAGAATDPRQDGRPRVAVTFDDGYADVMHQALPALEETQIPATIFVVMEGMRGSFWWDRLGGILMGESRLPPRLELEIDSVRVHWSREEGASRLHQSLYAALRQAEAEARGGALSALEDWAKKGGAHPLPPPAVLTHEQVVELDHHPLLEIGSHGASHRELRGLDTASLDREVVGSREELQALLGRPVDCFSYPHGILDPQSRQRVADAGYRLACASSNGLVHRGTDCFRLPRLWPAATTSRRFRSWLRGWAGR